jgi:hypothetical protein
MQLQLGTGRAEEPDESSQVDAILRPVADGGGRRLSPVARRRRLIVGLAVVTGSLCAGAVPAVAHPATVLSLTGGRLHWNATARSHEYIESRTTRDATTYVRIAGTADTPPAIAGMAVTYRVRPRYAPHSWSNPVSLAYPDVTRLTREASEGKRLEREIAKREAKELAEREAKEKAEREAKELAERQAKEKAEREAKELAERLAKEKAEREAKELAERLAKEKAEREAKELAERLAKEKAEREAKEKAEREGLPPPEGTLLGANISRVTSSAAPTEAVEVTARAPLVRISTLWEALEPSRGTQSWGKLDAVMGALAPGAKAILTLATTPGWANGNRGWKYAPTEPATYGNFCGLLARRYGPKVAAIEVWNEPNSPTEPLQSASGTPEAAYGQMYSACHGDVLGQVPVIAGALYYTDVEWLKRALGSQVPDGVSFHPYADGAAPSNTSVTHSYKGGIEKVAKAFPGVRLWPDEFGWRVGEGGISEVTRAQYLREALSIARSLGVAGATWYEWRGESFDIAGHEPIAKTFAEVTL